MFEKVKTWVSEKFAAFEAYIAGVLPGWKLKTLNLVTASSGSLLIVLSAFSDLPLANFVSTPVALSLMVVVNLLTVWLRGLSARVEERA